MRIVGKEKIGDSTTTLAGEKRQRALGKGTSGAFSLLSADEGLIDSRLEKVPKIRNRFVAEDRESLSGSLMRSRQQPVEERGAVSPSVCKGFRASHVELSKSTSKHC